MTDADGGKKWEKMIKYQCVISPSEVDILSFCPFLELMAPVGLKININFSRYALHEQYNRQGRYLSDVIDFAHHTQVPNICVDKSNIYVCIENIYQQKILKSSANQSDFPSAVSVL